MIRLPAPISDQFPARLRSLISWISGGYLLGSAAFIYLKLWVLQLGVGRIFPDSHSYAEVATHGLGGLAFWAGARPFTLPLLLKFLGVTTANYTSQAVVVRAGLSFVVLSMIAWLTIGLAVGLHIRTPALRLAGFLLNLAYGLGIHVSLWDRLMLSESVAISLFVLTIAGGLVTIAAQQWLATTSSVGRLAWFGSLWALGVLFSFARDSNVFILLSVGVILLVVASWDWREHSGWWRGWIGGLAIAVLAAALVQVWTISYGVRWKVPFHHVVFDRVLTSQQATTHFAAYGMPTGERLEVLKSLNRNGFVDSLLNNSRFRGFDTWFSHEGRKVYLVYLLANPAEIVFPPARDYRRLVHPLSIEFLGDEAVIPTWYLRASDLAFPRSNVVVALVLVAGLLASVYLWRARQAKPCWLVAGLMIASAPMLMLIVWHGDSVEIERHAFQAAFQLRLGFILLAIWIIDAALQVRQSRIHRADRPHGIRPSMAT